MVDETTTAPSIDELEAKSTRLTGDVDEATSALDVAKQTFADAAIADPTAVKALLELATAVKAAEGTVSKAESAVKSNLTNIEGIRYDERMAGVTESSVGLLDAIREAVLVWRDDNAETLSEAEITGLTATVIDLFHDIPTVSVKPTGENMPKRPTAKRATGNGTRGKRSVTVNGASMSCREYVASCGDEASPAAQAELAGNWEGAPVSFTNEAKRLAAKRGDTFA